MPVPNSMTREHHVLQERQLQPQVDNVHKNRQNDGDGVTGGRRTLKRNKTFTASNGRQQSTPNSGRRHRRGTKGRYTVPLFSAPASPMVGKHPDQLGPLYIQTSNGIFEEAFGDGKRNSLNRDQIEQLTAALALPEKLLAKQVSPTARSTTSSGFGSADALITSQTDSSKDTSPRSDITRITNVETSVVKKVNPLHFWLLVCIQYVVQYLRQISTQTRRRLETTPSTNVDQIAAEKPVKKIIPPALRTSRNRRSRAQNAKRKLQFEDEVEEVQTVAKPFYTELHLGRENQRATSLAAVEADQLEYPIKKLITRAAETKFVTTVFEVRHRGLEEFAGSVREEMQRWYGEHDDDLIIVCCEMQWSTPDKYRNVPCETQMKEDVMGCLRINNSRVLKTVASRNEKAKKFNQFLVLPDTVTEEVAGRRPGAMKCWGGSYRRYYGGLVPIAHAEAANEHEPWWQFKKHTMPESIDWPLIASIDKTTFIIVNMVCLKLNQL